MFGPIPTKLVQKIQALQYVDSKELLPDNIGLLRHMEALDLPLVGETRSRLREVNSLLPWALCFMFYMAVLSESRPGLVRSRLA